MRADICDADDTVKFTRFKNLLKEMGATCLSKSWGIGVDHWQVQIGEKVLNIFSDAWFLDIEGDDSLVNEIANRMK